MMNEYPVYREFNTFSGIDDLYICAMGFEDRSISSNEHLVKMGYKAKNMFVVRYDSYVIENEKEILRFEKLFEQISENFFYTRYSLDNRETFITNFKETLAQKNIAFKSITINISSLTTYALITLVNFAFDNADQVRILYTEPEGYYDQLESDHSFSSGVKDIFTIPEFSGGLLPGYSSLLVVFLGYDFVRARGTYEHIQPSKKIGIMALPNTPKLEGQFSKMETEHKKSFGSTEDMRLFSIYDLNSLIKGLSEIRVKHIETSNILLALNGSKLHSIGAILFAKKFRDVQLIASTPSEYFPSNYSYGVRKTYEIIFTRDWLKKFLVD